MGARTPRWFHEPDRFELARHTWLVGEQATLCRRVAAAASPSLTQKFTLWANALGAIVDYECGLDLNANPRVPYIEARDNPARSMRRRQVLVAR